MPIKIFQYRSSILFVKQKPVNLNIFKTGFIKEE